MGLKVYGIRKLNPESIHFKSAPSKIGNISYTVLMLIQYNLYCLRVQCKLTV